MALFLLNISFVEAKIKKSRFIRASSSRWFGSCRLANFYKKSYRNVWSSKKEQNWSKRLQDRCFSFQQWLQGRMFYSGLYSSGLFSSCFFYSSYPWWEFFFENLDQLERVNKDLFAMSVCTVDGQRFHLGSVSQWQCDIEEVSGASTP